MRDSGIRENEIRDLPWLTATRSGSGTRQTFDTACIIGKEKTVFGVEVREVRDAEKRCGNAGSNPERRVRMPSVVLERNGDSVTFTIMVSALP